MKLMLVVPLEKNWSNAAREASLEARTGTAQDTHNAYIEARNGRQAEQLREMLLAAKRDKAKVDAKEAQDKREAYRASPEGMAVKVKLVEEAKIFGIKGGATSAYRRNTDSGTEAWVNRFVQHLELRRWDVGDSFPVMENGHKGTATNYDKGDMRAQVTVFSHYRYIPGVPRMAPALSGVSFLPKNDPGASS